jgi:hypothetical protein
MRKLLLIFKKLEPVRREVHTVRKMEQIRKRHLVAGKVPALRQKALVPRHLRRKVARELPHARLVARLAERRIDVPLHRDALRERRELARFDCGRLVQVCDASGEPALVAMYRAMAHDSKRTIPSSSCVHMHQQQTFVPRRGMCTM